VFKEVLKSLHKLESQVAMAKYKGAFFSYLITRMVCYLCFPDYL